MNTVRRVAKNTLSLILARVVTVAFSVALVIYAGRTLGDAGFGNYSFIMVFVSYFYAFATFGMRDLIVRDVSRDKERADRYLGTAITLTALTGTFAVALILFVSRWVRGAEGIRTPLLIIAVSVLPTALYYPFDAVFKAFEKMEYSACIETLWNVVRVAAGIAALAVGYRLTALVLIFCLTETCKTIHACLWYLRTLATSRWVCDLSLMGYLARKSFPLMVWGLVGIIYFKVDIFMLMQMKGAEEVGWYSAAYRIIDLLTMCALFAMQSALPLLSDYHRRAPEQFSALAVKLLTWLVVAYAGAACILAVCARPLVGLAYGAGYAPSAPVLQVLGVASVLVATSYLFGNVLMAIDRYVFAVKATFLTTALNILLNLALIPRYGATGAAIATFVGEVATFAILFAYTARQGVAWFASGEVRRLLPAAAAGAGAAWCVIALRLPLLPSVLLVSACYGAAVWALKLVTAGDLAYLRRIAPK
jgi:O-antigen/teichoic acid export membrane protein